MPMIDFKFIWCLACWSRYLPPANHTASHHRERHQDVRWTVFGTKLNFCVMFIVLRRKHDCEYVHILIIWRSLNLAFKEAVLAWTEFRRIITNRKTHNCKNAGQPMCPYTCYLLSLYWIRATFMSEWKGDCLQSDWPADHMTWLRVWLSGTAAS